MNKDDKTLVLDDKSSLEYKYEKSETELLEDAIVRESSYDDFKGKYGDEIKNASFLNLLRSTLIEKNIDVSSIVSRGILSRSYIYQILNGNRLPSRDKIIILCVLMKCDLDEVNHFLKVSGKQKLYVKNKRDSALIYGISHGMNFEAINKLLEENEHQILA